MEKISLLILEDRAVIILSHPYFWYRENANDLLPACQIMDIKSIIYMRSLDNMPQPQPKLVNFLE
jgi:hypothetical protein